MKYEVTVSKRAIEAATTFAQCAREVVGQYRCDRCGADAVVFRFGETCTDVRSAKCKRCADREDREHEAGRRDSSRRTEQRSGRGAPDHRQTCSCAGTCADCRARRNEPEIVPEIPGDHREECVMKITCSCDRCGQLKRCRVSRVAVEGNYQDQYSNQQHAIAQRVAGPALCKRCRRDLKAKRQAPAATRTSPAADLPSIRPIPLGDTKFDTGMGFRLGGNPRSMTPLRYEQRAVYGVMGEFRGFEVVRFGESRRDNGRGCQPLIPSPFVASAL